MTSVIEFHAGIDADDWAKSNAFSTVAARAAAREQLARDMAIYEGKHGPVQTSAITSGIASHGRITDAIGDAITIKKGSGGKRQICRLTLRQIQVLDALRSGQSTARDVARHCQLSIQNVRYDLSRLMANRMIERVGRIQYKPTA